MPRNMSFALTTEQFLNRTKDVTRRLGWGFLQPGELLWGVKQAMGLKKGEKIVRLGLIKVVSIRREPLFSITAEDVVREGFPDWSREDFISFFAMHNRVDRDVPVNRIEFVYVDCDEKAGEIQPVLDEGRVKGKNDCKVMSFSLQQALLRFSMMEKLIVPKRRQPYQTFGWGMEIRG